jgi:hypothetical protein
MASLVQQIVQRICATEDELCQVRQVKRWMQPENRKKAGEDWDDCEADVEEDGEADQDPLGV